MCVCVVWLWVWVVADVVRCRLRCLGEWGREGDEDLDFLGMGGVEVMEMWDVRSRFIGGLSR